MLSFNQKEGNMEICYRYSASEDFNRKVKLKPGMCITSRINDNFEFVGKSLPYPDFVFIVESIDGDVVSLIDTQYNNEWEITEDDLSECELVSEFHPNKDRIDCEYINRILIK